ncbi:MAG: DUF2325 domain-containing protein [Nitrosomonas sp.]|nr:MAG: DUF2325 domain-containing protein [Nitrosomonas sp.]
MKFLKKQALAVSTDSISEYQITDNAHTFASDYLCIFANLFANFKQWINSPTFNARTCHSDSNLRSHVIDWAPLIKTYPCTQHSSDFQKLQRGCSLMGRSILCVGGRIKLYPAYARLIKQSNGNFITFHGNTHHHPSILLQLLHRADMIICPVDCINHEDYFTVKYYCQESGKPCILLDRSETRTFFAGIQLLIRMTHIDRKALV